MCRAAGVDRWAGGGDQAIRLWDIGTRKAVSTIHTDQAIFSLAVSGDGECIVSGTRDNSVRMWRRQQRGNAVAWLPSLLIAPSRSLSFNDATLTDATASRAMLTVMEQHGAKKQQRDQDKPKKRATAPAPAVVEAASTSSPPVSAGAVVGAASTSLPPVSAGAVVGAALTEPLHAALAALEAKLLAQQEALALSHRVATVAQVRDDVAALLAPVTASVEALAAKVLSVGASLPLGT